MLTIMRTILFVAALPAWLTGYAQSTATVSGFVSGVSRHDTIAGAIVKTGTAGAVGYIHGDYSLVMPDGQHTIEISMPGFIPVVHVVILNPGEQKTIDFRLSESLNPLEEIVVSAERYSQRLGEVVV